VPVARSFQPGARLGLPEPPHRPQTAETKPDADAGSEGEEDKEQHEIDGS